MTCILMLGAATTVLAQRTSAWWGMWNTSMGLQQRTLMEAGTSHLYMRLTAANSPQLVGGSISGIRFFIHDKSAVSKASVWIAQSYSQGPASVIASQEVPFDDLKDEAHDKAPTEVRFDTAFAVLPAGNAYANILVGLSIDVKQQSQAYLPTGPSPGAAGSWFLNGRDVSAANGALALQVLASGPLLPVWAVQVQTPPEQVVLTDHEAVVSLPVITAGTEPLQCVDYIVSIDGQPQQSRRYCLPKPVDEVGMVVEVPVTYDVFVGPEEHTLQIDVTKVNTIDNALQAVVHTPLIAICRPCTKRTVMEEFTGTWCHNCVRGIAGIRLLLQQYADRFIPIAMHSDDPMQVDRYRNSAFYRQEMNVLGGLPSCAIDRLIDCDPYCGLNTTGAFMTDRLVDYALQQKAVADLELKATYTVQEQQVSCEVATRFAYFSSDAHYRLMLVLTADSLTGEGQQWWQRNGYNDYQGDDPALLPYAGLGQYITDICFNHVPIDVAGVDGGIEGSITAPLSANKLQTFSYDFDVAQNPLLQHPDKLHLVAMLIDTRSGVVVNAAYTPVTVTDANPVNPVMAIQPTSQPSYDLLGRQLRSLPGNGLRSRGIIIRGSRLRYR